MGSSLSASSIPLLFLRRNSPIIKEQSSDHARQKKLLATLNDHAEVSSFIDGVLMIEVLAHVPEAAPSMAFFRLALLVSLSPTNRKQSKRL